MNIAEWNGEFAKYKQTPEFIKINHNISLAEFKKLYYIEYFHRLFGRLIGVVFLLPFVYFVSKGQLSRALIKKLSFIFLLGGMQGAVGWYMVASGLSSLPEVSHYRLAVHLIMASIIYYLVFTTAINEDKLVVNRFLNNHLKVIIALIFVQIFSGGLVAGLKAGLIYNEFPLMGESLWPKELFFYKPWYKDLFENRASVQFIHRLIAFVLLLNICYFIYSTYKINLPYKIKNSIKVLLGFLVLQLILGVLTLIYHVPLIIAVAHQLNALLLLSAALFIKKHIKSQ